MRKAIKIEKGQVFGRLTYISESNIKYKSGGIIGIWKCSCGKEVNIANSHVRKGNTKSCGCLSRELVIARSTKHGNASRSGVSKEYKSFTGMKERCYNTNKPRYSEWGGRGIKVCDRWLDKENGFSNFLDDMGKKPSNLHSLDRINNDGNYEPSNCRWATPSEQRLNKRPYEYIKPTTGKLIKIPGKT